MTLKTATALAALLACAAVPAAAEIAVEDGWVRAPPRGAPTAAAYLVLTNRGPRADRLLGARTPAAVSAGVHSMSMAGGVMRMRPLNAGLLLPPGARVTLRPGGDHLMLVGLKRPLRPGARLPLTLRFEHAGALRLSLPVRAAPAIH